MGHINSIHPAIHFTIEKERDNNLSFLDMLITRTVQGFSTSVNRKSTFIGEYVNFNSHYPWIAKKWIVRCLQHRAKTEKTSKSVYPMSMTGQKKFKKYVVHIILRQHSSFVQLFVNIFYEWNPQQNRGCPRGVMVKAMDCGIVVSEFVLQSRYYVHFRANTLGKGMNPHILPAMG